MTVAKGVQGSSVRLAVLEDAAAIARVQVASWKAAYRGQLPEDVLDKLDVDERAAMWRRILAEPQGDTLVTVREGAIVGFCHLSACRDAECGKGAGEVTAIYVDPLWWHHGYGLRLMREAFRIARAHEYERVKLWVLKTNHGARAFYETIGFEPDGATKLSPMGAGPELEQVRYSYELE